MGLWSNDCRMGVSGEYSGVTLCFEGNEVEAISIPTLLDRFDVPQVDILKMDIEGAEGEIFSCDPGAWLSRVKTLALEIHGPEAMGIVRQALTRHGILMDRFRSVWYCQRRDAAGRGAWRRRARRLCEMGRTWVR